MNYETQSQRIEKLTSDNAKSLLNGLRQALMECIVIPNETEFLGILPESLKNHKTQSDDIDQDLNPIHGPTLAQIQRKLDKIANNPTKRKQEEKNRRIKLYAMMHQNNVALGNEFEFEYCEPDEFWQEPKFAKLAKDIATA